MRRLIARTILIGLIGSLLVGLGLTFGARPPRTPLQVPLYQGVTYTREVRSAPRPLVIHMIRADLTSPGVRLLVTPGQRIGDREMPARTTSEFLSEFGVQVAINGGFFEPFYARSPLDFYPGSGDPVDVRGIAISDGVQYSNYYGDYNALCIAPNQRAEISLWGCPPTTVGALSGREVLVLGGKARTFQGRDDVIAAHPRTAVATTADGRELLLMVVDGRQPGYSEGISLQELAHLLAEFGAESALNLDGGGSSTLVTATRDGPHLLNAPIHTSIPMRERPVANHLGIYAWPLGTLAPRRQPIASGSACAPSDGPSALPCSASP